MSETLTAIEREDAPPLLKIRLPFPHRLNCFIRIWILKLVTFVVFGLYRILYPSPPSQRPTLVKRYPCRPRLQTRIYYPPKYKAGDLLSLYINIHGGGFALFDPQVDDEFCSMWAKRTGMLVVSLDYSKAPLYPFPEAVHDIGALANAVLADTSLPIDKSRVVIAGFSAGATLALCASQLPGLKGNINAALAYYPIVDWGHPPDVKLANRPYTDGPKDALEETSWWFDWAYVSPGTNRRDPLLSPCYARKEDLPPWIYIASAQWDMLRLEAQKMIHELAGLENDEKDFEKGTYKWTLAMGSSHGFTHHFGRSAEQRKRREVRCEVIYQQVTEWLEKALA